MLALASLQKLFRNCFAAEQVAAHGIIFVEKSERQAWMVDLKSRLLKMDRIEIYLRLSKDAEVDPIFRVKIARAAGSDQTEDWFDLAFGELDGLVGLRIKDSSYRRRSVKPAPAPVVISSVEQIEQFLIAATAQVDRNLLRLKRNDKLAVLRKHGLTARLTELGQAHGFSFRIGQSKRDVNLSIRVRNRKQAYHFSFPKTKLGAVLDEVPDLIKTLESLQSLSVVFRTNNKKWEQKQSDWIEPKSLEPIDQP